MHLPHATIRYVTAARVTAEAVVEAPDSLALVQEVMRSCRELRADGGSVLWAEFVTDGITRRRYMDGRVGRLRFTR